jgi:hypothetical protein
LSRKGSRWSWWGVLLAIAAGLVAFPLYRPDRDAPFEIIDFSETLPFLTGGSSFLERFEALFGYYLTHGRLAVGLSAGLAAKWSVFAWWTPGWQWMRFGVCLAVVFLAWRLLRNLGANRIGAAAGASLFLVAETVAPGWLRPSLNEPFGTLVLLSMCLVACRYQRSPHPGWLATILALHVVLLVLTKETLVAALFLPLGLALCVGSDGILLWPRWSRRNVLLVTSSLVAITAVALPVLWAIGQAGADGYARQFGSGDELISNSIFGLLPAVIPFEPFSSPGWAATVGILGPGLGRRSGTGPQHVRELAAQRDPSRSGPGPVAGPSTRLPALAASTPLLHDPVPPWDCNHSVGVGYPADAGERDRETHDDGRGGHSVALFRYRLLGSNFQVFRITPSV